MTHQKHLSVLPGNQRLSLCFLHCLTPHILSCFALICTSFFLCYLLTHLPRNLWAFLEWICWLSKLMAHIWTHALCTYPLIKTGYSGKLIDGTWCICVSGVKFFLPFFPYIIDKAFGMLLGHIFSDVESCSPCSLIPYAPVGALSTNFII